MTDSFGLTIAINRRTGRAVSETELSEFFFHGQWGRNGESISGPGSTLAYTEGFRHFLKGLYCHLNVKTFIDAPCGDFNWMKEMDLTGIRYYGFDIVPEIIEKNQEKYQTETVTFEQADICEDAFPKADLFMARDVLFHLPEKHIFRFFDNFLKQDIQFLLTTSHHGRRNSDIPQPGGFRNLNLRRSPYHLPVPLAVLPDYPRTNKGLKHPRDLLLFSKDALAAWRSKHV